MLWTLISEYSSSKVKGWNLMLIKSSLNMNHRPQTIDDLPPKHGTLEVQ